MKQQTKNTIWSVVLNLVTILCGLILPREILSHYGSEINGLVHSISQFLSYTVLLEFGIGAIIPASLYRPLAEGNKAHISAILASGRKVYRKIACVCIGYTLLLLLLFPRFSGIPSSSLFVLILGLGTVIRYFEGKPEQFLVISDQKGYVVYSFSAFLLIVSTIFQVVLIRSGQTLAVVKLVGTGISLLQIVLIFFYVRWHYQIDRKVHYTEEPIPQKWNGIAQHVAYFILENTDIVLLTLFTTFREVSVYSVYYMVISGIRRLFSSVAYSVQPKLGELKAKGNPEELNRFFASFERWIHLFSSFVFCLLGLLLVPFVHAYTNGITDADYSRPLFAVLMAAAYGIQSIRDTYDKLILASGHFKQTQKNYIVASCLNLGISIIAVQFWGLEGVAAGTLIAMVYQLIYMAVYDTKVLLKRSGWVFFRNILLDIMTVGILILLAYLFPLPAESWFRWILALFH